MAGPAFKMLKLHHARRAYACRLVLLLALSAATSIAAATQDSPAATSAPSSPALSSSGASYDTAANPDYYTFDLGTTLSGSAGGEVYVICVNPWAPFNFYNSTTNTLRGYDWDLFLNVSKAMGLSFETRVMGWGEMLNNLMLDRSDPSHCDIAPSAIAMTPDRSPLAGPKNLQLSFPTFHSGYGISTPVTWLEYDRWSFGRVFTVQLWAALLGTAAVLALLTYAAEHDYAKRGLGKTKYPTAFRPGMYEAVYNCVGKLFNVVQDLKVTSLAGKLISMGWGFLALVASTTYTAGITATLTALNFKTKISSVADLPHYRVVSYSPIERMFLKFGFIAKAMPWLSEADGDAMLNAVSSGAADALVVDYPWLQYKLAARCDLALVGKPFHYIDNGVGFNLNIPRSFIDDYNVRLMTLKQDGMYEEYQDKYLTANECPILAAPQMVVTFKQLEGLWIILGSFVGLAIILLILPHISTRFDADLKRTRSMFSIKSLGKSFAFASLARRSGPSFGAGNAGQDPPRVPKGVELHTNPSFAQDVGAKVVGSTSHLDEDSPGCCQPPGPVQAPELPQAMFGSVAPKAPGKDSLSDSVVPFSTFSGNTGSAGADNGLIHPHAELLVDHGAPIIAAVSPRALGDPSTSPIDVLPSPKLVKPSKAFLQLAHHDS